LPPWLPLLLPLLLPPLLLPPPLLLLNGAEWC
jgi:hypothetical protein